jgi:hypothetical protein
MYDVMRMRGKFPSLVRFMRATAVTAGFRYCAIQKYSALFGRKLHFSSFKEIHSLQPGSAVQGCRCFTKNCYLQYLSNCCLTVTY